MRPTVLIVDDHAAFRLRSGVAQAEGFDIVGEATDGQRPWKVAVLRPEIVLLDIQLPDLDGLAVAEQLAAAPDPPAVVLISSRDAAAYGPASKRRQRRVHPQERAVGGGARRLDRLRATVRRLCRSRWPASYSA